MNIQKLIRYAPAVGLVTVALIMVAIFRPGDQPKPADQTVSTAPVVLKGLYGGEKEQLVNDPEFNKILSERYRITLDARKAGSVEMVRDPKLSEGKDFLWPSNQNALSSYKSSGGLLTKSENVFNSPVVFYSWTPVATALQKIGVVKQEAGTYFVIDMKRFVDMTIAGKRWSEIGLPELNGRVTVRTTDPTLSNSGLMFAGLLANIVNGDTVDLTTVDKTLPTVTQFFQRLGFKEPGSQDLFQQYVTTGMGAKPMIAGYEAQIISFSQEPAYQQVKGIVVVLYPRPTVWSSHPIIAITPQGARLVDALKDPEIQKLAFQKHGFRSGLPGVRSDIKQLNVPGLASDITSVIELPAPEVMEKITKGLETK
jgi:hypothetical protein